MRNRKRAAGIFLAFSMLIGLCACGEKNTEVPDSGQGNPDPSEPFVAEDVSDVPLEKRYVYSQAEYDLSGLALSDKRTYLKKAMKVKERVYMVLQDMEKEDVSGECAGIRVVSMKSDGSDQKTTELALGQKKGSSQGFDHFQVNQNGLIFGVRSWMYEDSSGMKGAESICCWEEDGSLRWETPLDVLRTDQGVTYINSSICLKDGSVALLVSGYNMGRYIVGTDGSLSDLKPLGDYGDAFQHPFGMLAQEDGVMRIVYFANGGDGLAVVSYDVAADTMGEVTLLPASMKWNTVGSLAADSSGDLLYSGRDGVFRYHEGNEESAQIMDFMNSDLYVYDLAALIPVDNGHLIAFYYDGSTERRIQGGFFTKRSPEEIPDKELLTLAGSSISFDLRMQVVAFNKKSTTHRIMIRDYSVYDTAEDYYGGCRRLDSDIRSGNMPDILAVSNAQMPLYDYASEGLLADVGELMAKDAELSKTAFLDNVLDACRIDGKLYEVVPYFSVSTYAGKSSLVGERTSWTFDEAQEVLAQMPEGAHLTDGDTGTPFLGEMLAYCNGELLDRSGQKCNYRSSDFVALLKYSGAQKEELYWTEGYDSRFADDKVLLAAVNVNDVADLNGSIRELFGEDVSFAGFPGVGGQGSVIRTPMTFALSAQSGSQSAAWDFVSGLLSKEEQESLVYGMPVRKDVFDKRASAASGLLPGAKDLITSVTLRADNDFAIRAIVMEEAEQFYQGQRSAADAAAIAQTRVQEYLSGKK